MLQNYINKIKNININLGINSKEDTDKMIKNFKRYVNTIGN